LCLGYNNGKRRHGHSFSELQRPQTSATASSRVSDDNVEILGDPQRDWRIAMIDTPGSGAISASGLWAVREHSSQGEDDVLAN